MMYLLTKTLGRLTTLLAISILVTGGLVLSACDTDGGTGTVHVRLTDAPFPFELVDSVSVTVLEVRLVDADDSTDHIVLMNTPATYNLLALRNGVVADLAVAEVPEGDYKQIRMVVADDARIKLKDGRSFNLKIPSGTTSGVKINLPRVDVEQDEDLFITLDFDVSESFVVQGSVSNIQGFIFKPVIKALRVEDDGQQIDLEDPLVQ